MKLSIKQKLSRMGILPYLDFVRRTPNIYTRFFPFGFGLQQLRVGI